MDPRKFREFSLIFNKLFCCFLACASFFRLCFVLSLEEVNLLSAFLLCDLSLVVVLLHQLPYYSFALDLIEVKQLFTHNLLVTSISTFLSFILTRCIVLGNKVRSHKTRHIHWLVLKLAPRKTGWEYLPRIGNVARIERGIK